MRKFILLIFTLLAATSCLLRADKHELRTAFGASIAYEGTMYTALFNEITLQAVELDIIAQADQQTRKDLIAEFFPGCDFKISGNNYIITSGRDIILELSTDGKTLTTPGAKWNVIKCVAAQNSNKKIAVSCLTPNSWKIESSQTYQGSTIVFNSELTSSRIDPNMSPKDTIFEIICDQSTFFESDRSMLHCFTINEPLIINYVRRNEYTLSSSIYSGLHYYDQNPNIILAGHITDEFIHPATSKTDHVQAIISSVGSQSYGSTNARITYSGLTENWDWERIQDYHKSPSWWER